MPVAADRAQDAEQMGHPREHCRTQSCRWVHSRMTCSERRSDHENNWTGMQLTMLLVANELAISDRLVEARAGYCLASSSSTGGTSDVGDYRRTDVC